MCDFCIFSLTPIFFSVYYLDVFFIKNTIKAFREYMFILYQGKTITYLNITKSFLLRAVKRYFYLSDSDVEKERPNVGEVQL